MKKFITILFVSFCPICSMQASAEAVSAILPTDIEVEIEIKATTVNPGLLRSAPAPAVSAWLSDAQIDLTFLQDLGTVNITVTGAQGTVYQTGFAATDGAELAIDTQGWVAGDYVITIVRSNGKTYEGAFEL